jgi:hypothetical protein
MFVFLCCVVLLVYFEGEECRSAYFLECRPKKRKKTEKIEKERKEKEEKWLEFRLCVSGVHASKLGPETGYPD